MADGGTDEFMTGEQFMVNKLMADGGTDRLASKPVPVDDRLMQKKERRFMHAFATLHLCYVRRLYKYQKRIEL